MNKLGACLDGVNPSKTVLQLSAINTEQDFEGVVKLIERADGILSSLIAGFDPVSLGISEHSPTSVSDFFDDAESSPGAQQNGEPTGALFAGSHRHNADPDIDARVQPGGCTERIIRVCLNYIVPIFGRLEAARHRKI